MRKPLKIAAIAGVWASAAAFLSCVAGGLATFVYGLLGREPPEPEWLLRFMADFAAAESPRAAAAVVAGLVFGALVLAPVLEEFLFRGLLQGWLERHLGRPKMAVLLTALLFAAVHRSLFFLPALFAVSLCFSAAKAKGGGLAAPMLAHSLYNAFVLAVALWEV